MINIHTTNYNTVTNKNCKTDLKIYNLIDLVTFC